MRYLKMALAGLIGLSIYGTVFQRPVMMAMADKVSGGDQPCPWPQLAKFPWSVNRFQQLQEETAKRLKVVAEDPQLGLQQIQVEGQRPFWIKKAGEDRDGFQTLAYILPNRTGSLRPVARTRCSRATWWWTSERTSERSTTTRCGGARPNVS